MEGRRYIVLQDVCGAYKQPCVLDAKVGVHGKAERAVVPAVLTQFAVSVMHAECGCV
jgi:hypothetical protein